jgi:hypothetical protein
MSIIQPLQESTAGWGAAVRDESKKEEEEEEEEEFYSMIL